MKKLLAVLVLAILMPTTAAAGDPRAHFEEIVLKWATAFNAGDSATIASFYTEDASIFPPGGERVDGRSAIQTFWQGAIDTGMKVDFHAVKVDAWDDVGVEVGALTFIVPGDSGPTEVFGKYIVVWKRTGHTWQLYRDIWNVN